MGSGDGQIWEQLWSPISSVSLGNIFSGALFVTLSEKGEIILISQDAVKINYTG